MTKFAKSIPPSILAFSLMLVYLYSMAPGLTWANNGSDGGDLIAAAATGGVAHPTGYPTYLLLARLFQLLPFGSLAFRTNLMSAVAATIAALFVFALVSRSISFPNGRQNWLAGLAAAYAFGLSPLVWSQAVITEVYTLHALFVTIILYLLSEIGRLSFTKKRSDQILGLAFGLAMGNHITTLLLFPLLLPSIFFRKQFWTGEMDSGARRRLGYFSLLRRLSWLGIGLLVYLSLPLRALSNPPINWGNPVTLDQFSWLVSGKLYQDQLFVLSFPDIWSRIQSVAALLVDQFGIPGLVVGLLGLIVFFKSSRLYGNMLSVILICISFAVIYATQDSFVYLIPAFLCFAILIGLGLGGIVEELPQRYRQIGIAGGVIFVLYLLLLAGNHWSHVDASRDHRAEHFGEQVLVQAPQHAIVFARGDKALFAMWYFHYALGKRPDLIVVSPDLLSFDWYQETLHDSYPDIHLPGPFPFSERMAALNPERSVCYISYNQIADINCVPPSQSDASP